MTGSLLQVVIVVKQKSDKVSHHILDCNGLKRFNMHIILAITLTLHRISKEENMKTSESPLQHFGNWEFKLKYFLL